MCKQNPTQTVPGFCLGQSSFLKGGGGVPPKAGKPRPRAGEDARATPRWGLACAGSEVRRALQVVNSS